MNDIKKIMRAFRLILLIRYQGGLWPQPKRMPNNYKDF